MELRTDKLLAALRDDPAVVLALIDADPLLVKRSIGELVLANATKLLFTPQEPHQLYAKGIVYRRSPFELVSLPLVKIYNLGERNVTLADVASLMEIGTDSRLLFLRKFDGTLVQRFQHDGQVWFTTRGMIEGAICAGPQDDEAPTKLSHFDYLSTSRRIAAEKYPQLLQHRPEFDHLTLLFEFLHPDSQVITDYAGREDLVLIAAFDKSACRYVTYRELQTIAAERGFTVVDAFQPQSETLAAQIDELLAAWKGTDQEGTVIVVEHGDEVIYRVKVKSPDYLRLLKLVVSCTYARTVEMIDAHPEWQGWPDLERQLQSLGSDRVPEEVLAYYREHYDAFVAYILDIESLMAYGIANAAKLRAEIGETPDLRLMRKQFAERATKQRLAGLLFAGFDGRLSRSVVRRMFSTPEDARTALAPPETGIQ